MKIGRPPLLTPEQIQEIIEQLKTPYYGQQVSLAFKYGVKPEVIRKLKQRSKSL